MKIEVKLKEVLIERGMTQKELKELTNLRASTISEIARNSRTGINKEHLATIASALNITDIRELMDIVDDT